MHRQSPNLACKQHATGLCQISDRLVHGSIRELTLSREEQTAGAFFRVKPSSFLSIYCALPSFGLRPLVTTASHTKMAEPTEMPTKNISTVILQNLCQLCWNNATVHKSQPRLVNSLVEVYSSEKSVGIFPHGNKGHSHSHLSSFPLLPILIPNLNSHSYLESHSRGHFYCEQASVS